MSRVVIDPTLRGRATPQLLDRFAGAGMHVHRVGRAAYVHTPDNAHRWLLVIGSAAELEASIDAHHRYLIGRGDPTPLQLRRLTAWLRARSRLRWRNRHNGRFVGAVPWWATVDAAGRLLTPRHLQPWRLS